MLAPYWLVRRDESESSERHRSQRLLRQFSSDGKLAVERQKKSSRIRQSLIRLDGVLSHKTDFGKSRGTANPSKCRNTSR